MALLPSQLEEISAGLEAVGTKAYDSVLFTLADRLCNPKWRLSAECARTYDEVICWLSGRRGPQTRSALANRLAHLRQGPEVTVRALAYDSNPEVACPVLRDSPLLTDKDLIEIAMIQGEAHLSAIAARTALRQSVTGVILGRGGWSTLRALATNATAGLSCSTLHRLAKAAQGDGAITVGLLKRSDLPPHLTVELLARCRELARRNELNSRGEDSGISLDQLRTLSERNIGAEQLGVRKTAFDQCQPPEASSQRAFFLPTAEALRKESGWSRSPRSLPPFVASRKRVLHHNVGPSLVLLAAGAAPVPEEPSPKSAP